MRGNVLLSLVYANPLVPALGLAVGALVSLSRHEETGRPGHLALAALQAAAVPFFKVFLGAQLVLGLGVAFLLARNASRRSLAIAAAPIALATALLALGQGGETVAIAFDPFDLVRTTRETLGLDPVSGLRLAAAGALWLLLSLGLRLAGLGEALRALRGPALGSALAAIALSGWPLGLLFRVSAPEMLAGQNPVNDAGYLLEQSGPLLWVFAAMALARFAASPARRLAVAAAVLLFATPATLQYAVKKAATAPDRMPATMVRAMRALESASRPGDVVLQRPGGRYPAAPVVLAGRRVTYERFTPYLTQFVSRADLEARHAAVYGFFRARERDEALAIARRLGASFLVLYDSDRVRFDTTGVLEPSTTSRERGCTASSESSAESRGQPRGAWGDGVPPSQGKTTTALAVRPPSKIPFESRRGWQGTTDTRTTENEQRTTRQRTTDNGQTRTSGQRNGTTKRLESERGGIPPPRAPLRT